MFIQQFFVPGLAHTSYLLGAQKSCAIIDPRRDVGEYLQVAKAMGMKITHILETHLHADFISGHMDLTHITGAKIFAPKVGKCHFDHVGVADGDIFEIEDIELKVMETPGHTPEHVSYMVTDQSRGTDPVAVFTGDTLFVGDVGRPDLFPGKAEELASKLFNSVHNKLMKLPDFCEVYPAHGAGSLCGRAMGAKRSSTIGYEKRYNNALKPQGEKEFKEGLLTGMPEAPDHFSRCSAINARGPTLVKHLSAPHALDPKEVDRLREQGHLILDVREYMAFAGEHIPGAYHIDLGGNFATFAGWVLPPEKPIVLVAESEGQVERASVQLHRVGLDEVTGYLDGGMYAWAVEGLPIRTLPQMAVQELKERFKKRDPPLVLDVRAQREWDDGHIQGAVHIASPDTRSRYREIDPDEAIAVMCNTGHRSSMAASILLQHGFKKVYNVAGGMTAWAAAGYTNECPVCPATHGPRV
jgi:rhodanese-related sulfurtransferase